MKINDVYKKHAAPLLRAAEQGRPYAALTYGPNCQESRYRTFADKSAASAFLDANTGAGTGRDGVVALTDTQRKGPAAFYIRYVSGYKSFP